MKQELFTLSEHLSSPPVFSGIRCYSICRCRCMLCRSLFVLLSFSFCPLCCLFFCHLRILITRLEFSNSFPVIAFISYAQRSKENYTGLRRIYSKSKYHELMKQRLQILMKSVGVISKAVC